MLTSKERMTRILKREPVDRVGLFEVFWADTAKRWAREGHYQDPTLDVGFVGSQHKHRPMLIEDHFGLDLRRCRAFEYIADLDAGEKIIEETEETKLVRDGNGALLRWCKKHSGTPEHVDFLVKDRKGWEESVRPHLVNTALYPRRIDFELYRSMKEKCQRENIYLTCAVVGAFDQMTPMCGHEYLLMGMALDPEWIRDMCEVYTTLTINLLEILFAQEGLPDGLWVWDDLGFKGKPFMSPNMYQELLFPGHQRLFQWARSRGLPVILHSCGYVEPLMPALIEAGIDCLQPLEVKAGMDLVKLKKEFGDRISFIGGMDVRTLVANDRKAVQAELKKKLPAAMQNSGYVLQVDHSVPYQVDYATYRYFMETGLAMGVYK
jgi:uroporphyrinogen decarboxylase